MTRGADGQEHRLLFDATDDGGLVVRCVDCPTIGGTPTWTIDRVGLLRHSREAAVRWADEICLAHLWPPIRWRAAEHEAVV